MPDELTSVIATAACLVAAFWLGQAMALVRLCWVVSDKA